jgi:hypothetical protein
MRLKYCAVVLALGVAGAARAQSPGELLPDTLGANLSGAPGTGSPTDFDFLVGEWSFTFQSRVGTGWGPQTPGTWIVRKIRGGLVVEDVWTLGETQDPTLSWRVFNPARKLWEMQGLKAQRGSWDPGVAWGAGDERYVLQTFAGITQARIKYYRIKPDRFSWRADASTDGGKTWIRDVWILEARRVK